MSTSGNTTGSSHSSPSSKAASADPAKLAKEVERLRAERRTKFTDLAAVRELDQQIRELDGQRQTLEEEQRERAKD